MKLLHDISTWMVVIIGVLGQLYIVLWLSDRVINLWWRWWSRRVDINAFVDWYLQHKPAKRKDDSCE